MRTVQMTLEASLVSAVARVARQLRTTRSAFTRQALKDALEKIRIRKLELIHRQGYQKKPVQESEFSVWETEQVWGDL